MTSVLNVDTIADKAGTGPVGLTKQYAAKAWSAFDGSGTVAIDGSNNVSTLTDGGTGDYTITLINSMANVNYAPVSSCNYNDTSPDFVGATVKTVSTTRFRAAHDNGNFTDMNDVYATWDGDLA